MATRRHDGRGDDAQGRTGARERIEARGGGDPFDRQAVFESLFDHLARTRSGSHPHRMATHLLRRADGSTRLVALVDDGRQAVLFDLAADALVAVPFDEHGLADEATVGLLAEAGPATWLAANREAVGWIHPRYRAGRGSD